MTTQQMTDRWSMFAAHAAAGYLAMHSSLVANGIPEARYVAGYAADVASYLMTASNIIEASYIEEEKENLKIQQAKQAEIDKAAADAAALGGS